MAEAEELQVEVIEISKRMLGEEHHFTLRARDMLAFIYMHQKRWNEAEALHLQAIEIERRVLGAEHPDTLASISELAEIRRRIAGGEGDVEPTQSSRE